MTRRAVDVVIVEIDGLRYGLLAADVIELLAMVEPTPLPGAPAVIEGAVNWRGEIIGVAEARRRLGDPSRPPVPSDRLVIVTARGRNLGLRVDATLDLERIDADAMRSAHELGVADHVSGVAPTSDGLLLIYDLGAFLTDQEFSELNGALETTSATAVVTG